MHVTVGRKEPVSVDLSRLVDVSFLGGAYGLRDEEGHEVVAPLDERLRFEVRDAAAQRRLELDRETDAALTSGNPGGLAPKSVRLLLASSLLVPLLLVGVTVFRNGGVELERDNSVDAAKLLAANAVPGATLNPFARTEPRELYLVGLDAKSQRQLPHLAATLRERFGIAGLQTPPYVVDAGVIDSSRAQLDGWTITARLLSAHGSVHPGRPVVVIAVTRLDTFYQRALDDRFAFMTSGATAGNVMCGGLISTARFDVWPGSEEERLGKMAGRLLGRCLGIEEEGSIRSIRDVDRLDELAGADAQTIALRLAERRALPGAPSR